MTSCGLQRLLDKDGCYLVKFPFDKNNTSCRVRSIQPYDGPTQKDPTGLHFPLRENTLVAVGFLDGDLSQPIIIGAMNDESKPSPVTNTNKTQHIIQTTAEHKLMFEDQAGKQGITLSNKDDANKLNLDATENKNSINLTSKGKIQTYANKDMHVKNAKNNITKAAKDLTIQVDGKKNLLTKNKAITHQAGQDVLIKAKDKITTNTVNKTTLKAQEDVLLQAEKNMQFHSNKSINFESTGNTTISGTQITFSGGNEGGIQLGGPGFGIEVKDGNVTLNGAQINFNCGVINVPTSPAPATPVPIPPPQQVPELTAPKAQQKKQEDDKNSTDDQQNQNSGQGDAGNSDGNDDSNQNSDDNDASGGDDKQDQQSQDSQKQKKNSDEDLQYYIISPVFLKSTLLKHVYNLFPYLGVHHDMSFNNYFDKGQIKNMSPKAAKEATKAAIVAEGIRKGSEFFDASSLKRTINNLRPKISSMMPKDGGVLVSAIYDFSPPGETGSSLFLVNAYPASSGSDYKSLIAAEQKKNFIAPTPHPGAKRMTVYVWVIRK